MQWFGKSWGAEICVLSEHVATPAGKPCLECDGAINPEDSGFVIPYLSSEEGRFVEAYYHRDCFLDSILGRDRVR